MLVDEELRRVDEDRTDLVTCAKRSDRAHFDQWISMTVRTLTLVTPVKEKLAAVRTEDSRETLLIRPRSLFKKIQQSNVKAWPPKQGFFTHHIEIKWDVWDKWTVPREK